MTAPPPARSAGELDLRFADRLLGSLRAAFPAGVAVADVGGGAGAVAAGLATRGVRVLLVDPFDSRSEPGAVPFVRADACALPFRNAALGGVHLARTLHHVDDWRSAVRETARVLGPGGVLCLDLGGWLADGPIRDLQRAVGDEAGRQGVPGMPMPGAPGSAAEIDVLLAASGLSATRPVAVSGTQTRTAAEVVAELVARTDRWAPGHDRAALRGAGETVLAGIADPAAPLRQQLTVTYRVYRRATEAEPARGVW